MRESFVLSDRQRSLRLLEAEPHSVQLQQYVERRSFRCDRGRLGEKPRIVFAMLNTLVTSMSSMTMGRV